MGEVGRGVRHRPGGKSLWPEVILHRGGLGKNVIHLADLCRRGEINPPQAGLCRTAVVKQSLQQLRHSAVQPLYLAGEAEQGAALTDIHLIEHHVRHGRVELLHPLAPELGQLSAPAVLILRIQAERDAQDLGALRSVQRLEGGAETVQPVEFGQYQIAGQRVMQG